MTDKEQIMIDGVDVSKCDFSLDCIGIICQLKNGRTDKCNCSDYPNCYFKQLARKTQECESLKEEIEVLKDNFDTATRDCNELIEELRQECEELKDARFNLNCEIYSLSRYRKALEEIEKVCIEDTRIFADGTEVRYDSLDEILNIINKAKGEEDKQ